MATEAVDNQILGALLALFQAIGGPSTYLTTPLVAEGVPPDPLPAVDQAPLLYLSHVKTVPANPPVTGPVHRWTATYAAWIAAKDQRITNQVRADVLRRIYAGEGTLATAAQQPAYPLEFTRLDANRAGVHLAVQLIAIDYQTDHTAT
jgi:hypothetical protein